MIDLRGFPVRILIVDDHDANRESLARTLRYTDASFVVETAAEGSEALARLAEHPFDVVLCDLMLGGELDGIAVTRAVCEKHPQARIVVFTGQERGESKEEVLAAGAFSYLSKPVPHQELVHAIETVSSIRRTERLHRWFETLSRISFELQASFDFDTLARRIVDGVCELGYSRARLYLLDEERQVLVGKESSGMPEGWRFDRVEVPFEHGGILQRIFQEDRPLFLDRATLVEHFEDDKAEPWVTSLGLGDIPWVDCPLLVQNQRIGTLAVDHLYRPDYRYTEEDRQILTFYSGLAAQALNNSRLYEQEALAKASLQSILEKVPDAVITTDLDGTINFASPSSERVLGVSHREVQGRKAEDFYSDELHTKGSGRRVAKEVMDDLRQADEGLLPNRSVYLALEGRSPRPILLSASLLHDDDGKAIGTLGILKDLGPLGDQTRPYQDVLEAFGYGTLLLTEDGETTFVNRKAERLLGRRRRDLLGRRFTGWIDPAQTVGVDACLERLRSQQETEEVLELTLVHPTGPRVPVTATFTLASGAMQRRKTIALALSDKRELGILMQSQRLMALGELVAGIGHEVNNPLNLILPAIQDAKRVVERRGWSDADLDEDLDIVADGGRRIRDIIRQLREFGRPSDFEPEPQSLNALIEESLGFFAARLRNREVEIDLDLDPELPLAQVDRKRILQVLLNLVVNAEQAMVDNPGDKRVRLTTRRGSEGRVVVAVTDNGPGIPEELRQSIFDPFFTTKEAEGTGLGLSVSRSILRLHGGQIDVGDADPATGLGGAEIWFELPAAGGEGPAGGEPEGGDAAAQGAPGETSPR